MKSGLRLKEASMPADAAPLGAPEFAALMESFVSCAVPLRIAAAVSGGPDSMALAFCLKRWLDEKDGGAVTVFIVDHALRETSTKEAEQTQKALANIGVFAEILRWRHEPVIARLHETARKARYQLLIEACHRHGIADLLLAHQREDQAETILMRFAKGSGVDGLCGMSAQSVKDGVRLLRPCLNIPRARLRATCHAAGLSFISDPGNESEKFARGRLRRVMPLLAAEGFTIERLIDLGERARDVKAALGQATALLVETAAKRDEAGVIRIDLDPLRNAPRAIAERALGLCLRTINPRDYAPERAALIALLDRLCAGKDMPPHTLHGCLIGKNRACAWIMREYSAIGDQPPIRPGETVLWDRRWQVSLSAGTSGGDFIIRPLGSPPHQLLDRLAPGLRRQIAQGRARASLPALWFNGALALIPALPRSAGGGAAEAAPAMPWPPALQPASF